MRICNLIRTHMKNSLFCHASCIAGIFLAVTLQAQTSSPQVSPKAVLDVMQRVADWQLANPSKHKATDWTQGAGDAGLMALAGISGDVKYRNAMLEKGATNDWKLGLRKFHADDHAVGQAYCELYYLYRDPKMLAPLRAAFDNILNHPSDAPSLDFALPKHKSQELWSWCDSLFMAPPAWVRLYAATGDERYLNFAVKEWWRTSDYLYDNAEHLYFRDSSYFKKTEANGKKVFWGRGNGWVMGGLVRTLQYLPVNHPDRPRFEKQFKEMSAKILTCQQPDGLWRASLLDPDSYPLKETSGSGFYTYALAWGVNQGLLDSSKYKPAVSKAWAALVACVDADGKLTHVQPIGADPKKFDEGATEVYGVGAFLLAGSEVYKLAVLENAKPIAVKVTNPANFWRECETVEFNGLKAVKANDGNRNVLKALIEEGKVCVLDGLSPRILVSQVYISQSSFNYRDELLWGLHDKLLFQVDLAPGETRTFYIVDATALPAVPPPLVKTFARYVPERFDDFAWESDRIAHRTYGLALIP